MADGFTEDQQFFLGFGQAWCAKVRPEAEAILLTTSPHAPFQWRVNGALAATPDGRHMLALNRGGELFELASGRARPVRVPAGLAADLVERSLGAPERTLHLSDPRTGERSRLALDGWVVWRVADAP